MLADRGEWRIEIHPAALKFLRKLGWKERERIAAAISRPSGEAAMFRVVAR